MNPLHAPPSRPVASALSPAHALSPASALSATNAPPEANAGSVPGTATNPKVMAAARDFEAMAIGQLLEPIFDTVDTANGLFGGGEGESNFKPMLVTEMAKQVEQHGGFGLADSVYQQMLRMQEKQR